jgi:hypothetical protein
MLCREEHRMWKPLAIVASLAIGAPAWAQAPQVIRPTFDRASHLEDWTIDGSGVWAISDGMLMLTKAGVPAGPIRRPAGLAILKTPPLGRFTFEVDLRSEEPVDLLVRDVDLVIDWQSPSKFYYVHLAAKTDPVHNGIFLVHDADRRRLDRPTSTPQLTDMAWHHVRLERDPGSGRIAVFVGDGTSPALEAADTTLASGRVGLGSFDETGQFKNVVVTVK